MVTHDVVILGAGPAGSTLAYLLAKAGLSILVLDRADGPEFKVGESLLPEGIRLCHEMGLQEALADGPFIEKHGAQFVLSEDGAQRRFAFADALRAERGALAYEVKRRDFDAMLQRHAEAAGAEIHFGWTARNVHCEARDAIAVSDAAGERIEARYLADATGEAHVLARQFGLRRPSALPARVALFSHFAGVRRDAGDRAGDIVILWTEQGWSWVIPFLDGTTSVGVVTSPETLRAAGADDQERFDNLCAQNDVYKSYLAEREQLEPLRRHADYSFECPAKSGDRFLLMGDASGFVDPIFSTGVFLAQMGAFAACDVIAPALLAGEIPDIAVRREFENKLGLGARRYLALVQRFYDGRFMADMVRAKTRRQTQKALTSVLAGDIFDADNPLIRMGVFGE